VAISECRECGGKVSTEAASCPHCGAPAPARQSQRADPAVAWKCRVCGEDNWEGVSCGVCGSPREQAEQRAPSPEPRSPAVSQDTMPVSVEAKAAPRQPTRSARFLESAQRMVMYIVGWTLGVLIVVISLAMLFDAPLQALLILLASLFAFPPVAEWVRSHTGLDVDLRVRVMVGTALFGTGLIWGALVSEKKASAQTARAAAEAEQGRRDSLRAVFSAQSTSILASMDSAARVGDFAAALAIGSPFRFLEDSALSEMQQEVSRLQQDKLDSEKEQELLAKARTVPSSDINGNRVLYAQLVQLRPENARYKERYDHYDALVKAQRAAEEAQRAFYGPQPTPSAWDGSYPVVTEYLKLIANDPSRIKIDACTKVYRAKEGWLVGCDYFGANAFGGIIRASNWFIIRQGRVVAMKDASAYRP